ncbi:hypothetical protein AVEN_207676-1 [Araneus ventricosus]|uniref:Uncharacterized protein n=1 Tax=Araneus ventricosus TaxID=182803 RepID=A0A4Y2LM50_ARAVE|nr:hypothetical protein AVEN_207676-1 [Araneus ventricosus]
MRESRAVELCKTLGPINNLKKTWVKNTDSGSLIKPKDTITPLHLARHSGRRMRPDPFRHRKKAYLHLFLRGFPILTPSNRQGAGKRNGPVGFPAKY